MGNEKMRAAVMIETGRIALTYIPIPEPGPGEVLIKIKSVGICGSDVHFFTHGHIGPHVAKPPFILGHEASGEVIEVTKEVKDLKPGDRVTMEPGVPCGACQSCRIGRYNLCDNMKFWAAPPVQGVLADYAVHDARFCYKIPDRVSFEEAAMTEPLSVGVYAAIRSNASPGKCAVIFGAGPVGQLALQACIAFGLTEVIVTDITQSRVNVAKESGARLALNPAKDNVISAVMSHTSGRGADIVFETAGSVETVRESVHVAKRGGIIVQIGNPPVDEVPVPILMLLEKELTMVGSFRYAHCFPGAVDILSRQKANISRLISHRFSLEEVEGAFILARDRKKECMKIIINL